MPNRPSINDYRASHRETLRKQKTVTDSVKTILYNGNIGGVGVAIQFDRDLNLYGLWEALMYVEGMEREGYYKKGTAVKALLAAQPVATVQPQHPADQFNEAIEKRG